MHSGLAPDLHHYRESRRVEIDLLVEYGGQISAVEIKSGATSASDFFKNLRRLPERLAEAGIASPPQSYVVYGGALSQRRTDARVLSWHEVQEIP